MDRPPRVLIADELDPAALEVFRRRGIEPLVRTGLSGPDLLAAVADVEGVVVRSATKLTRDVIGAADCLRVIGRAGIGVDNIDVEAATERGIVVMNTPRGNATTTAELAITLLLALARHVPQADRQARAGWKKRGLIGTEVTGKVLGVIGLGRIGRLVAQRARGLEMKVVAYDPYLDVDDGSPVHGVELVTLDDLLARADFLTLHVPLTDTTRDLLSWEELAKVKPGARLINASRGGVVNEEAVLDALAEGRLSGAAFDVLSQEPPPPDHPLLQRDDVILTPHLGASSSEAQLRVAMDVAEQIATYLLDGVAQNAINAPTLPSDSLAEIGPYLVLAEKLGSLVTQLLDGLPRKVELTVRGDVGRHGTEHFRLSLLVGILEKALGTGVNFVNAPSLASERGVLVLESLETRAKYTHGELVVHATERAGGPGIDLVGTVFGREPRIVRVDGVDLDLPPRGTILVTRHFDRPGVLGLLGGVLGKCGVNIQRLELGPIEEGGDRAYGFLTVDREPDAAVMDELRALDAMEDVRVVRL